MPKFEKIKISNIFGEQFIIEAEIVGERTHGYNLKSGAWSLYPDRDGTSTPAEFLIFRKKRKRKLSEINKNRLVGQND